MNASKSIIYLLIFLTSLAWLPAIADVKLGVFPRRPPAVTVKAFKPLVAHLEKVLGEKVQLIVPKNFKAFWKGVANKEFDIVHYNQYHYIKSHKDFGYNVMVTNEEFGSPKIAGALSVRKDSGINSVADLKGKTILFGGGKKAMGSYIAPTAILKKAGLEAGKDYKVSFAKNPPSAVIGVYNHAADASGSGNVILKTKGVKKKIDVDKMKILAESDEFTHLAWAVNADFPADKMTKIQKAMTSLKGTAEGDAILKSARVTNFHTAVDADFSKVREITKFAIGEEY